MLIENLQKDNFPILFEGLHTTFPLFSKKLNKRKVFVRAHNIEHDFYEGLGNSEENIFKRNFFFQEAKKLKNYEKILKKADGIITISPFEQLYFEKKYGTKCNYIPAFFNNKIETQLTTSEKFVFYHGNIAVSDNAKAASFLINVFKNTEFTLKIASSFSNNSILEEIKKHNNITFIEILNQSTLTDFFEKAHIHILPTFQKTGIKLKLLNTLHQGRFVIANDLMVQDTGLETLCTIANTKDEILENVKILMEKEFLNSDRIKRFEILKSFSPETSSKKIVKLIFT